MIISNKIISNLSNFKINNKKIGKNQATICVNNWIDNFKNFDVNIELVKRILNNIKFIFDDEIIESCCDFVNTYLLDYDDFIISPFGLENESSARITEKMSKIGYNILNIHRALEYNKKLIFIDDFLISGGQFISIIKSFLSKNDTRQELNLNKNELEKFKKLDKIFIFNIGTETGRLKANDILKENQINGNVIILEQFNIKKTFFGKISNLIKLENSQKLSNIEINNSIFYDFSYNDIKKIYDILKLVGIELLKINKKHWSLDRIDNSFLGYGNSGGLIISEYNVPTFTLCSLWMEGKIIINNNEFFWKSLVKRKEKTTGKTEHISY